MFTYREGISVLQLVVFAPALCAALILAFRHGWGRTSGWYFLIILSLLRIVGGITQIISVTNPSKNIYITAAVCELIGIAPLVALCAALLSRINDHSSDPIKPSVFKFLNIIGLAGFIVSIVGATQINFTSTNYEAPSELKAGVALFTAVLVGVFALFCVSISRIRQVTPEERRLFIAVGLSLPFLLVRIIYALLAVFSGDSKFNPFDGNTTIYLCMDVLEELIVVIVCTVIGLTLRKVPKAVSGDSTQNQAPENLCGEEETGNIHGQSRYKKNWRVGRARLVV